MLCFQSDGFTRQIETHSDSITIEYGHLNLSSEIDSFYVVINSDFDSPVFVSDSEQESLSLPDGFYQVRIIKPYHFDVAFNTFVIADSTRRIGLNLKEFTNYKRNKARSSYPRLFWGGKYLIRTDRDSDIILNDSLSGSGHIVFNEPGEHRIQGYSYSGENFGKKIQLSDNRLFEAVDLYFRPERSRANFFSVIPGRAQIYKREPYKAAGIVAVISSISWMAIKQEINLRSSIREYDDLNLLYATETDPVRIIEIGNEMDREVQNQKKFAANRNWLLAGVSAIYILNVLDARRKPRMGFREEIGIDPYLDFDKGHIGGGIQISKGF